MTKSWNIINTTPQITIFQYYEQYIEILSTQKIIHLYIAMSQEILAQEKGRNEYSIIIHKDSKVIYSIVCTPNRKY